jgi:hypothetical protein
LRWKEQERDGPALFVYLPMEAMIEPVILSDAILNQARLWQADCVRRWAEAAVFPQIGGALLTSPVDGQPRKVVLHLGQGFNLKARTLVGVRSSTGQVIGTGNTIILNRGKIHPADAWMPILLHELTHAVDPYFEDDFRWLNPQGQPSVILSKSQEYHLASEQRAFPAMWIQDLRKDLDQGQYRNPSVSITLYCLRSAEFRGFWDNTPDLAQQTEDHFRRIVKDLNVRRSNVSEQELKAIPQFAALPIYDEVDAAAESITRVQSSGARFTSIREMTTLEGVRDALSNPKLVPLGGVRNEGGDGTVVVFAYFGEKRP